MLLSFLSSGLVEKLVSKSLYGKYTKLTTDPGTATTTDRKNPVVVHGCL